MTTTNRELFLRDPTVTKIPNDGVTTVERPHTDEQWDVLRWELHSFVCEGQYARGLERILQSFLNNLGHSRQPAAWVSGFYGSGKSHLVRVLEYLWRDVPLPDGARARDLVTLPDEVQDHLRELTTQGKRAGGLWSSAGTLAGKGESVRLAFLSLIFASADLPEDYAKARFTIWAHDNGYLDRVRSAVEAEGRTFGREVHDLYVSPIIARALLEVDPSLADDVKGVRELLRDQFPPTAHDVSDEAMFKALEDVLRLQSTTPGKLPLTLIVLDEVQQYIGDDNGKALDVQDIVEGCATRFESSVLLVGTGQSALTATPTLSKLVDRYPLPVELSDNDVETVVRQVVLRKKPEHVPRLQATLDAASGEIARQLGGTRYAQRGEDEPRLASDYPVLPSRWRLWSDMLRAVDRAGRSGLVRSQLGLIHGGVRWSAHRPVGNVIGVDYLFFDEKAHVDMLMSGVLLREVDDYIQRMVAAGGDDALKGRLCALIFLISQMSQQAIGGETGLRPTAASLADLLIEDLTGDGPTIRKRVPELLQALVAAGRIVQVEDEYRLLTDEDAEWEKDYRSHLAAIRDDVARLTLLRTDKLHAAVEAELASLKLVHGSSKTPRKIRVHWGQEEPTADDGEIAVWVRDEWSVTESAVRKAAAEQGDESPTVFVLLPKHDADAIRDALASAAAAEATLRRPLPQTDEGKAAQRAMRTRLSSDEERLVALISEVVKRARVLQGGGAELTTSTLRGAVETAATRSLVRLFPKFKLGDHADWGKVVTKAREGAPDALEAVGHHGEPTTHPVCKEILAAISAAGTQGTELQKRFTGPPFGWPKDAVNGAVLTLFAAGHLRVTVDVSALTSAKQLPPTQIGKATISRDETPPTMDQQLRVRGLLTTAGIAFEPGQEAQQLSALLQQLKDLAARAGGPPPLPAAPDVEHLDALLALAGNERFRAIADNHERLSDELDRWKATAHRREQRERSWASLERLLHHAHGLPVASEVEPAVHGIREGRQLLDDPDPVQPILDRVTTALRQQAMAKASALAEAQRAAVAELEAWPEWQQLDEAQRDAILAEAQLRPDATPGVASNDELLHALDAVPLSAWQDRVDLVPARRDQARQRAARLVEPKSVHVAPPPTTFKPGDDPTAYFDELRARVQAHLDAGETVVL